MTLKQTQAEAQLAKKTEQVIKLVAQNKQLLTAIGAAEQVHGIKIDLLQQPQQSSGGAAGGATKAIPAAPPVTALPFPSPDELPLPPPPPGGPTVLPPPPPPAR
jgi:hypothetical protein